MNILKGLLGFILKPNRNGSGEIRKVYTSMNLSEPNWPKMDN